MTKPKWLPSTLLHSWGLLRMLLLFTTPWSMPLLWWEMWRMTTFMAQPDSENKYTKVLDSLSPDHLLIVFWLFLIVSERFWLFLSVSDCALIVTVNCFRHFVPGMIANESCRTHLNKSKRMKKKDTENIVCYNADHKLLYHQWHSDVTSSAYLSQYISIRLVPMSWEC